MGLQTKAIKQKMKSVNSIRKITRTMEMVSVAKMKKTTERVIKGRSYSRYALELLHHIAVEKNISHELLEEKDADKELILVISSNKGLAGSYNINISKALTKYKNTSNKEIECVTIGKQSEKSSRRNNLPVVASFVDFSEKSTSEEFLVVADTLIKEFKSEKYSSVKILYTEFKSSGFYKPFIMQILPVKENIYKDKLLPEEGENSEYNKNKALALYEFEPSEEQVLNIVVRQLLEQAIFNSFLESLASEHSARMFAMKNAGDSAKGILNDLTLYYNQVRQSGITQEIAEIVSGSSA